MVIHFLILRNVELFELSVTLGNAPVSQESYGPEWVLDHFLSKYSGFE